MHNARNRTAGASKRRGKSRRLVRLPDTDRAKARKPVPPSMPDKSMRPQETAAMAASLVKPTQRRKSARKRKGKVRRAVAPVIALPQLITLPQREEPLVTGEGGAPMDLAVWSALPPRDPEAFAPEPVAPSASRALAPYRGEGLLVALADWLGSRALGLWRQLAAPGRQRRVDELARLRRENARLRRQLEFLRALEDLRAEPETRRGAPIPLP